MRAWTASADLGIVRMNQTTSYPLNFLPFASDMRGRIADLPGRVLAEETLWELAFRAKPPR